MSKIMNQKIKKSLIFLCFIVLSSLFFFHFAQANGGFGPKGAFEGAETETTVSGKGLLQLMFAPLGNAIIALITIILQVLLLVAQISLDIAVWLLIRVTHPDFISLSYTNPAGNPLLATGWALVRNLTNMGFVISFAFIGLATALRIKEYQAQKTLLPLILMALLVNFTPVILGVIVDASNILMNFLLGEVASFQFIADMWGAQKNIILGQLKALIGDTINYGPLAATITLIIFAGTTSFIILLYILLFLFRYVAIWILVILSPLAFFSYVLPVTRKIWSQWWNQFLQWCFIGVSMAFFLYLSNHLLAAATQGKITSVLPSSEEAGGLIETLLPYGMIIALLIYGLLISLSTSATGASYAIKAAKGIGKGTLAATAKGIERRVGGPAAEKVAKGLGAAATWTRRLEEKAGPLGKVAFKPLRWATRGAEMAAVPALTEYAAKKRRVTLPAGWKQMSITEKERYISALPMASDRLVLASEMKGKGTFQKASDQFQEDIFKATDKFKGDARYKKEVGDILDALPDKVTKKRKLEHELAWVKDLSEIAKIKSEFQKDIQNIIDELERQNITVDENKATAILHARSLKPKDIAKVTKGSLKSESFQLAMQKMSSSHLQSLQNNFDEHTVHDVLEASKGLNTITTQAEIDEIYKKNPRLVRWAFETPAGKEMLNWSDKFAKPFIKPKKPKKIIIPPSRGPRRSEEEIRELKELREELKKEPKKVSVPFLITREMREKLKEKGYKEKDIRKMTPKEAWKILGGMPE